MDLTALFVHGMGRSSGNWRRTRRRFAASGIATEVFDYSVFLSRVPAIVERLRARLIAVAARGPYIAVGHSLGGVLLRAALADLPAGTRPPEHLFLLGSPIRPARLARLLRRSVIFPFLTRDAGRMLGSAERMARIPAAACRTTAFIGVNGWNGFLSPFGAEPNDIVVAESEVVADWFQETIRCRVIHAWMPMSRTIADQILARLAPRAPFSARPAGESGESAGSAADRS